MAVTARRFVPSEMGHSRLTVEIKMQRSPYFCQQAGSIFPPQPCILPWASICTLPPQGLVTEPSGFVNVMRKQQVGRQLSLTMGGCL